MAVTTPKERRPQRAQSWAFSFTGAALQAESLSVLGRFVSRYTYGRNGLQRLTGPNPTPCLGREFGSFITCIEFRRAARCRDVPADDGRGVEASHQLVAAKLVAIGFNLLIRSRAAHLACARGPSERIGWSSSPTSNVAGSTDHKDDRECQWQANGESPGDRQAECRKQIYLRAQPISRHAVFSDAGEQTADAVTASARRHLSSRCRKGCAGIVTERLTTAQVLFGAAS